MNINLPTRVKLLVLSIGSAALVLMVYSAIAFARPTDNFLGYAWSSNVGWISTNNCNTGGCPGPDFGITSINNGGVSNISGYVWSPNVGWIAFDGVSVGGCLTSPNCQGTLNWTTGVISGWARACSVYVSGCSGPIKPVNLGERGDWDGWISLSKYTGSVPYGVTMNTTTGQLSGLAWGSEVLGWIDFSGVKVTIVPPLGTCTDGIKNNGETGIDTGGPCAPTVTLTANPNPVLLSGDTSLLAWTPVFPVVSALNTCTATSPTNAWSGNKNIAGGTQTSIPITAPTTFVITCSGPGGSATNQVTVTVAPLGGPGASCTNGIKDAGETGIDTGGPCAPTVTLTANPNPVLLSGDTSLLAWTPVFPVVSALNTCTATSPTNAWSGNKNIAGGTQTSIPITAPTTFVITCSGPGGSATNQVTVTVAPLGGPGASCTNIPVGVPIVFAPAGKYVKRADGSCTCISGYILNTTTYQCVKPAFQEN